MWGGGAVTSRSDEESVVGRPRPDNAANSKPAVRGPDPRTVAARRPKFDVRIPVPEETGWPHHAHQARRGSRSARHVRRPNRVVTGRDHESPTERSPPAQAPGTTRPDS